jgi:prepilin-type N-terminal cleavage/methylation domain-containing protein
MQNTTTFTMDKRQQHLRRRIAQHGFTIIELITVLGIISILAIVGLFAIPPFIIEGKVEPAAKELQRAMQRAKINAEGAGATPFAAVTTAQFANMLRNGSSVFTVTGTGTGSAATHSLRALGSGALAVAPATFTTAGDAYAITLSNVNNAACPNLAAVMQKSAPRITINGTVVQNLNAGVAYNGLTASETCTLLDANTFLFEAN